MTLDEFEDSRCWLLHNLPDIEIDVPEDSASVDVVIMVGSTTIYEEKLYSEDGSICWIRDISSLLEPYISTSAKVTINGRWSIVMFSRYEVTELLDETLATDNWLKYNFLSAARKKYVYETDKIVLAAANVTDNNMQLKIIGAYYQDGIYQTKATQWSVTKFENVENIRLFNFTFADLQNHLDINEPLVGFSIALDDRLAIFKALKGVPAITLKWKNCFGIFEFMSLEGNLTTKPNCEISNAIINGYKKNIDSTVEMGYELVTGPISTDTRDLIRDLILSNEIYICESKQNEIQIVIEDADLSRNSDKSEMQGVSLSFRRSKRGGSMKSFIPTDRIFTAQFDNSYN